MLLESAGDPWCELEVDLLLQRVDKEDESDAVCISQYKTFHHKILDKGKYSQRIGNDQPLLCPHKRNSFHLLYPGRLLHFDRIGIWRLHVFGTTRGIGSRSFLIDVDVATTGIVTVLSNARGHRLVQRVSMNVRHFAQLGRGELKQSELEVRVGDMNTAATGESRTGMVTK
jgi:hypothetical protein